MADSDLGFHMVPTGEGGTLQTIGGQLWLHKPGKSVKLRTGYSKLKAITGHAKIYPYMKAYRIFSYWNGQKWQLIDEEGNTGDNAKPRYYDCRRDDGSTYTNVWIPSGIDGLMWYTILQGACSNSQEGVESATASVSYKTKVYRQSFWSLYWDSGEGRYVSNAHSYRIRQGRLPDGIVYYEGDTIYYRKTESVSTSSWGVAPELKTYIGKTIYDKKFEIDAKCQSSGTVIITFEAQPGYKNNVYVSINGTSSYIRADTDNQNATLGTIKKQLCEGEILPYKQQSTPKDAIECYPPIPECTAKPVNFKTKLCSKSKYSDSWSCYETSDVNQVIKIYRDVYELGFSPGSPLKYYSFTSYSNQNAYAYSIRHDSISGSQCSGSNFPCIEDARVIEWKLQSESACIALLPVDGDAHLSSVAGSYTSPVGDNKAAPYCYSHPKRIQWVVKPGLSQLEFNSNKFYCECYKTAIKPGQFSKIRPIISKTEISSSRYCDYYYNSDYYPVEVHNGYQVPADWNWQVRDYRINRVIDNKPFSDDVPQTANGVYIRYNRNTRPKIYSTMNNYSRILPGYVSYGGSNADILDGTYLLYNPKVSRKVRERIAKGYKHVTTRHTETKILESRGTEPNYCGGNEHYKYWKYQRHLTWNSKTGIVRVRSTTTSHYCDEYAVPDPTWRVEIEQASYSYLDEDPSAYYRFYYTCSDPYHDSSNSESNGKVYIDLPSCGDIVKLALVWSKLKGKNSSRHDSDSRGEVDSSSQTYAVSGGVTDHTCRYTYRRYQKSHAGIITTTDDTRSTTFKCELESDSSKWSCIIGVNV